MRKLILTFRAAIDSMTRRHLDDERLERALFILNCSRQDVVASDSLDEDAFVNEEEDPDADDDDDGFGGSRSAKLTGLDYRQGFAESLREHISEADVEGRVLWLSGSQEPHVEAVSKFLATHGHADVPSRLTLELIVGSSYCPTVKLADAIKAAGIEIDVVC